jgi:iron-sulfur cluster repair protein YtfE (RIC family)
MKRHPALIPLSEDHHQALLLAMILKKNAPKINNLPTDIVGKMNYAKEIYKTELEHHFRDEEEFVFPYLNGKDSELDILISEIMNEHIILKEKILSLTENPNLVDQLDEIGKILELHVRKEERNLFEKAQIILNDDELKLIENKFDESRPQNKSCSIKSKNK